jgi:hypothetical protein
VTRWHQGCQAAARWLPGRPGDQVGYQGGQVATRWHQGCQVGYQGDQVTRRLPGDQVEAGDQVAT